MKNGVPFDVAHNLAESGPEGEAQALAYNVVFSRFEGQDFDWTSMTFIKPAT